MFNYWKRALIVEEQHKYLVEWYKETRNCLSFDLEAVQGESHHTKMYMNAMDYFFVMMLTNSSAAILL